MDEVRLGIIGLGNMGKTHLANLRAGKVPGLRAAATCDSFAEPGFDDGVRHFKDATEMLNSGLIDAVLIATPHYFHTSQGIEALEAGLHVLVEKPLSVHKADALRLIAAHRDKSKIFAAMFNQRTDPMFKKVREYIQSGELGEVRRVLWDISAWFRTEYYYASGGWRATWKGEGGGVLLNQCPHNLDIFQWLFGMPQKVTGFCQFGRYHQIEVEDDVTAHLQYPDGKHATILTSTGESPGANRLQISAERGMLIVDAAARTMLFRRNRQPMSEYSQNVDLAFGQPEVWDIPIPVPAPPASQHNEILQNFTNAILRNEPLLSPAEEGIHSVELANAILMSAWEGKTLDLPMDHAAYEAELGRRAAASTFEKKKLDPNRKTSADDFAKSFR